LGLGGGQTLVFEQQIVEIASSSSRPGWSHEK
jgi:hypothetical protein